MRNSCRSPLGRDVGKGLDLQFQQCSREGDGAIVQDEDIRGLILKTIGSAYLNVNFLQAGKREDQISFVPFCVYSRWCNLSFA